MVKDALMLKIRSPHDFNQPSEFDRWQVSNLVWDFQKMLIELDV